MDIHLPHGWIGDAGQDLEQRALARAVCPDKTKDLAAPQFKADLFEGPDRLAAAGDRVGAVMPTGPKWGGDTTIEDVAQALTRVMLTDLEPLA